MINTFGSRIKELRLAVGLSQNSLAEILGINAKSIQRYETNKLPDTYSLVKLATYFDVSIDFLLGLMSYTEEKEEHAKKRYNNGQYNEYYRNYIECKNKLPDETAEYYWINSYIKEGERIIGGQTYWDGWINEKKKIEKRKLRLVNAKKSVDSCTRIYGKPMILNEKEDVIIFLLFGGEAIVKKEICEQYLPEFMEDFIGYPKNI